MKETSILSARRTGGGASAGAPTGLSPRALITILAVLFLSSGSACWAEASTADKTAQIDKLISRYTQCGYLNGAVLVAEHGHVIYEKGVGLANLESKTPNTPQTKFGIASLTKQFTAALVLHLADQHKIRLDGTVSEYLPWYRRDTGNRITVDQLLHHTSGLPPDYDSPEFADGAAAARRYEPQEFAEKFCQPALVAEPGAKWAYSNCGYVLLGLILERVTGKPFADLLNEQILLPLGMKNTGMDHNDLAQRGGAIGYTRRAGPRYTPGPNLDRIHGFAAGAMYSTVEDLFLWNQALSSSKFFSSNVREEMFQPGLGHWADGWFVTRIPQGQPGAGNALAEMRGDMPGNFFAWVIRYPDQDDVLIVLRNGYGSTEHLEQNLQAILFGQPTRLPSRSPKDLLAHACQVTCAELTIPGLVAVLAVILLGTIIWLRVHRRKRTPLASLAPACCG
jgi:CubicO group peptidase (beta-lactamase class C family)